MDNKTIRSTATTVIQPFFNRFSEIELLYGILASTIIMSLRAIYNWNDIRLHPVDFVNEYFLNWMKKDLRKAIQAKSNLLAALGLSVYTEVLGGYLNGTYKKGQSVDNYEAGASLYGI